MIYRLMIKRISNVSSCDIPDGKTQRLAHRLLLKLKEHEFDIGGGKDAIAVYFKEESNHTYLTLHNSQKWVAEHIVDVTLDVLERIDKEPDVVAEKLEEILSLYATENCTCEMIHEWIRETLEKQEKMECVLQEKKYYGRKAVLSIRYLDTKEYLPIIRVYDTDNSLVLEDRLPCVKYLSVLDVMEFTSGRVTVRSKKRALHQQSITVDCKSLFKRKKLA